MTFLLSGVLAHLVADFACFGLAMQLYGTLGLTVAAGITVLHIFVDYLKSLLSRNLGPRQRLLAFVADQFVHMAVIVAAWEVVQPTPSAKVVDFYSRYFAPRTVSILRALV